MTKKTATTTTSRKPTLSTIAKKYRSDKGLHGYLKEYQKRLPKRMNSLLEIGVAMGQSALMWKEFYPKAEIHLLDLFKDPDHVPFEWAAQNGFTAYKGDQSYLTDLAKIQNQFDVIIDDGSHNAQDQIISFKHLFHNNLLSGGVYSIEDCHCNKDPFYYGGYVKRFEDTPLWMFKNFIETGALTNPYLNEGEQAVFKSLIKDVKILCDDKLILIWRK